MPSTSVTSAHPTLDVQVQRLVDLGYPTLSGRSEEAFRQWLRPLTGPDETVPSAVRPEDHVPFVLVVPLPDAVTAPLMTKDGRPAILMLEADELARFTPIAGVEVPAEPYLLADVDVGADFCGVRPADAQPVIVGRGRTPLTIAEGVALVTQRPDMLRPNKCFSLLGSRCGDKRVPAIWISAKAPKLGWCWQGNPHTWLGAASAGGRHTG